ncbi:response regulator [Methylobacterium sp. R2-1]|uniref:response regulator n=1 Tax=Methylobacterium sp. R2-1 TaxID=2587064 RepID=UPI00184EBE54|nr:response regulator [Methylobacterium sp. R2-1]MBB2964454.1 DNA-binding response OmpR family regulator [Methylobacterium sp. R2-1]
MSDPILALSGRRVLIVEDEYLIAHDMEYSLQQAGAEVVGPIPDAQQALALIKTSKLDAAILDVNLRKEEVYSVADKLSASGIPYLFATGEVQIADRSDYRSRPKLEKPILEDELLRAVGKLIQT